MKRLLSVITAVLLLVVPGEIFGQAPVLGTAAGFVLYSSVGAVTNTGISHLTGNVGTNSGSSTGFGNVDGVMHDNDGASGACGADLLIAYGQLAAAIPTFFPSSLLGNGDTLLPGIYHIPSAATLNGNLILNAQGNANAVFIFQIEGAFASSANAKVKLINGGVACNVFWKTEGQIDLGAGTTMKGTLVAHNAAINLNALDTLEGRALAIAGAITLNGLQAAMPLGCGTAILTGPLAPALLSTANYGIFSGIGPVTNAGITHVIGDVGTNSGLTTGFNPLFVTGMIHPVPDGSTAACATDLTTVYNFLNTIPTDIELLYPAQFGNDLVLTPHTYLMNAATTFTGNIYLNAEGNSNAVFVIKINGALSTGTFSNVMLINGTRPENVYWKVDGAVDVYDNSVFNGNIIANNGAIHLRTGTTLHGRALTTDGAVSIDAMDVFSISVPNADTISGASNVCIGSSITLTDTATGGVWSATNGHATVLNGIVTGISTGIDTIRYIITNVAGSDTATHIVTINPQPNAGTISGAATVCTGNIITLTDTTTGGIWSATNSHATVVGGVITGITSGIDTIRYTVTNTCGADTATHIVTINPQPNAGAIIGAATVCTGNIITLTDATVGGIWSATNSHATVVGGVITGITSGIDTIRYTVTNTCGADTATHIVTINPQPNAGAISGAVTVCTGNIITLTDATVGGIWSATNSHATVIGGVVTGVTSGIDTIRYTVTNTCGADTATQIVTINPQPNAGTISGAATVCTGNIITLTDATLGGIWSATNSHATVIGGVVTGVTSGIDTIRYTVTNTCGADTATHIVTVNPQPNAGVITGPSSVCIGNIITLTDATTGGIWSVTNTHATVIGGVVTGMTSGIDTIMYLVSNTCGTDTATKLININTIPNAGTISGPSTVCVGNIITLTDATTGGVWSATNTNAIVIGGVVTASTAGIDTIRYTVTNSCGADTAIHTVTVNLLPNAGVINGATTVCVGDIITLTDATTGGTWAATNTNATVVSGVVTGFTAGIDTIMYMASNTCGTDTAFKIVTINPLPALTSSTTPSAICDSAIFNYTPSSTIAGTTYAWSRAVVPGIANAVNSDTAGINEPLYNTTNSNKIATYIYTLTANGCSATENVTVIIHPTPKLAKLTDSVCTGVPFTFAPIGLTAGSTFSWTRNSVTGVTGGALAGIGAINDTLTSSLSAPVVIIYAYVITANTCSFDQNVSITLFPSINAPVITTQSPLSVCTGTMYQNFGTSIPPQSYAAYNWSATNAQVWAQGANSQYAIVSFIHTGNAYVTLTAGIAGTACSSQSTVMVTAGTAIASVPTVSYFYNHFICTPSNESSYQWGYDDATTLDSTILSGEINQDYVCVAPDYSHKFYWVMTTADGCSQKTYYNTPTIIQNINNEFVGISVYPNPGNNVINVVLTSTDQGQVQIDLMNMMGQIVVSTTADNNKATIDVAPLAVGSYMVVCYRNGVKVAGSRFMKN